MSGWTITLLHTGKRHSVAGCGAADGSLWITLDDGTTMAEAAVEFGTPENVKTIIFAFGEMEEWHEGYTRLAVLMESTDGLQVCLRKDAANG